MNRETSLITGTVLLCCVFLGAQSRPAGEWNAVASAMGKAGAMQPGDLYKIALPRFDMNVNAGGAFFMHFWANDNAAKLARGLRAALDKTNLAK